MLREQIKQDLISAMKSGDTTSLAVLRMVQAAVKKAEIDVLKKEASNDDVVKIVQKEIKMRRDSVMQYEQGGRPELAEKEKSEIGVLEKYLPEQMGEEEITKIVEEAVRETGATSPQDMGKVMAVVMPKVAGRADGGLISTITRELLDKKLS